MPDRFHPSGPGRIEKAKCNATFDIYIPVKWDRFPFVMMVTRQRHCHFPPPPDRLPSDIANEVVAAIQHQGTLEDLTAREFISVLSIFIVYTNL